MNEIQAVIIEELDLHKLVMSQFDVQHMRILFENRFRGTKNNSLISFIEGMVSLETNIKLLIKGEVQQYPIHRWIIAQKGLSYDLAGQLIGLIHPISRFSNISMLWSYTGMGVMEVCENCGKRYYPIEEKPERIIHISKRLMEQYEKKKIKEGKADFNKKAMTMLCHCAEPKIKKKAQRKIEGVLLDYNPTFKTVCYKVGVQFVKQGSFYRNLYDKFKDRYEEREDLKKEIENKKGRKIKGKNGEITEAKGTAHIHMMAQRKMVKIFLEHLWIIWRELEGLPVTKPYPIAILGHADYIPPPPPSAKDIKKQIQTSN